MRNNKNIAIVVGIILFIFGLVFLLIPEERLDKISNYIKRSTGDMGTICLDYFRKNLKDPDSAKLIDSAIVKNGPSLLDVVISYKAKNSYGAYVNSEAKCAFSDDGKIDELLTDIYRVTSK